MLSAGEHDHLVNRCRCLPPAVGSYLVDDYVTNLLLTVLDFQLHTTIVRRAHDFYQAHRSTEVKTFEQLKGLLARFPDDPEGNTALAQNLWGYRYGKRIGYLRGLVSHFESIGVTTQERLTEWARTSDFDKDFKGRVPGLAYAVYKWLVMRQGVETIKPDVHVRRFVDSAVGRIVDDQTLVSALEGVAREIGLKAYELDWRIWEFQRKAQP
jgi:hypothetical protein